MAGFGFQVAKGFVDVVTKVDKDGVRRGADDAVREIDSRVSKSGLGARMTGFFGKSLGAAGKSSGKLFGLGFKGAALASTANTAMGLVTSLAPAVGAIGLLPAAAIAAKVATGTLTIALSGLTDAVGAGLTGDTKKLNEAMKEMPPAMQTAVKAIVGLKPQIDGLKKTVQGNFWGQFNTQISSAGKTYLPMLATQLGIVATGFGKATSEGLKILTLPSNVKMVNTALSDTGASINNVSAGVPGLIQAFLPLWQVGASFLPGLTAGFDGLTNKVAGFMLEAQKTGQLHDFISGGLSVIGELGQLLGNIGSILFSVFQAAQAGGGNLLGTIGQLVGQFAAFLNTAQGMQALESIFTVLGQVGAIFGQAFALILPIVAQVIQVLSGPLQAILPVISGLLTQLTPTIQLVGDVLTGALAVILPVIVNLLTTLMPVVGQLVTALAGALAPVIMTIAQVFATLVPIITPIITMLASALMPIITALSPVITVLAQVLGQILGAALTALMPLFQTLLPVIAQLVTTLLPALIPIIQLIGQLFMALMPAIQPVISLLADNAAKTLQMLTPLLTFVAQAIAFLITKLIALIGPIVSAIGWVANFFNKMNEAGAIKDKFVGAMNAIKNGVSAAIGWVKDFIVSRINTAKNTFLGIASIVGTVIGFFGRIQTGIANKIGTMISFVKGIPGKIKSALGDLGNLLKNAGKRIIQGLIDGVTGMIGSLKNKFSSITNMIPDWKGPMQVDMKLLEPSGKALMGGLMTGVGKQVPALQSQLQGITAGIPRMVGGTTPQPAMAAAAGATTIQQLTVNITTPLSLKTKAEKREFASAAFSAIEDYKKEMK